MLERRVWHGGGLEGNGDVVQVKKKIVAPQFLSHRGEHEPPFGSYDGGYINASAEGVSIRTGLKLSQDPAGRIKVSNVSCEASVSKMDMAFGGTFK